MEQADKYRKTALIGLCRIEMIWGQFRGIAEFALIGLCRIEIDTGASGRSHHGAL